MSRRQELVLLGAASDVALEALRWTEAACAREGLDGHRTRELGMAALEAVNNSIEHGYSLMPGDINLAIEADAKRVVLTVSDFGTGLPAAPARMAPDASAERGRGSWIMQQACDEVRHEFDGCVQRVVLVKQRAGHPGINRGEVS